MLKEIISSFPVENYLEEISKLKTKDKMKVPIHKQILRLKEFINKHAQINIYKCKFTIILKCIVYIL